MAQGRSAIWARAWVRVARAAMDLPARAVRDTVPSTEPVGAIHLGGQATTQSSPSTTTQPTGGSGGGRGNAGSVLFPPAGER